MKKVKIITDSTADLSPKIINKKNIGIVPLYVVFDRDVYKDGFEITTRDLYRKVEDTGKLPKTSAPTPADFAALFKPYIDEDRDIIYIGLSSHLSATIQNARLAAERFPNGRIHIIDSLNLSSGIGLLVLQAADYAELGMPAVEIVQHIEAMVAKVRTYFAIDTLEYLQKGGRCSAIQNLIGNLLKIKPILQVKEGKIGLHKKIRGKKIKTLDSLIMELTADKEKLDLNRIIIIHSCASGDLLYLKNQLKSFFNYKEIISLEAGCVISSHCGPKSVGIMYLLK